MALAYTTRHGSIGMPSLSRGLSCVQADPRYATAGGIYNISFPQGYTNGFHAFAEYEEIPNWNPPFASMADYSYDNGVLELKIQPSCCLTPSKTELDSSWDANKEAL